MTQGHGNNSYKTSGFDTRDNSVGVKALQRKEQERKEQERAKSAASSKAQSSQQQDKKNPWGSVLKNEQHFKSLHMC